MKIECKNENYAATVVQINKLVPLENCDNVQAAIIMGNQVIVGKDVSVGNIGLYFPLETQLTDVYLSKNNLYRKPELNSNNTKKGYFEENGRIRCVKFRGHKSEGLFMPLESLEFIVSNYTSLKLGETFDTIDDIQICRKYVIQVRTPGEPSTPKSKKSKVKRIIDTQFRFHQDTSQLYKNLHKVKPDSLISVTYKIHGTSGISSYVLVNKPLKWYESLLRKLRVNIPTTMYDYIHSSRKVIKTELNASGGFYNEDIWGLAHNELKEYLTKGITIYYEIAGFLPSGKQIQKHYDYGSEQGKYRIFIYRITQTNTDGKVFEFSAKQVQQWAWANGLYPVPELYYGTVADFLGNFSNGETYSKEEEFYELLKHWFTEKDCFLCVNKVPEEGCVVRIEGLDFEAYKLKSNRFYIHETSELDRGNSNIEDEN